MIIQQPVSERYTAVTFTVAMQKERTAAGGEDETILKIGTDDVRVEELSKDMIPTAYIMELGEDCERLLFFLERIEKMMPRTPMRSTILR